MRIFLVWLLLAGLVLLPATACKIAEHAGRPGASTYVNLGSLVFTVKSVEGQVQVKPNRNAPWRDLLPGDTFDGYALIRSGFQSGAQIVMQQGPNRSMRCELGDLICAVSINDVYDRVLSPDAVAEYNQNLWKKDQPFDPGAPVGGLTEYQLLGLGHRIDAGLLANLQGDVRPHRVDVTEGELHLLVIGDVDARDARHKVTPSG